MASSALSQWKISDVATGRKDLVFVPAGTHLTQALALLHKYNLRALPVFSSKDKTDCIGILDVYDIMIVIAFANFKSSQLLFEDKFKPISQTVEDTLGVTDESKRVWIYDMNDPVSKICEAFSKGVHRALLRKTPTDPSSWVLVSQTDLLRFFISKETLFQDLLNKTVADTGLLQKSTLSTINLSEPAVDGFRKLYTSGSSGLAVVDDAGKIVSALSPSDVRSLTGPKLKFLAAPVLEFLEAVNGKSPAPVTCTADSQVGHVIVRLLNAKVHRAWVVDGDNKPIGVISQSDLINLFYRNDVRCTTCSCGGK